MRPMPCSSGRETETRQWWIATDWRTKVAKEEKAAAYAAGKTPIKKNDMRRVAGHGGSREKTIWAASRFLKF